MTKVNFWWDGYQSTAANIARLFVILIVGPVLIALLIGAFTVVGVVIYFGFTGGGTYIDHVKVNGVECIITRDRLTNEPSDPSCPPIQAQR